MVGDKTNVEEVINLPTISSDRNPRTGTVPSESVQNILVVVCTERKCVRDTYGAGKARQYSWMLF
jgi:hypothetical protein